METIFCGGTSIRPFSLRIEETVFCCKRVVSMPAFLSCAGVSVTKLPSGSTVMVSVLFVLLLHASKKTNASLINI